MVREGGGGGGADGSRSGEDGRQKPCVFGIVDHQSAIACDWTGTGATEERSFQSHVEYHSVLIRNFLFQKSICMKFLLRNIDDLP